MFYDPVPRIQASVYARLPDELKWQGQDLNEWVASQPQGNAYRLAAPTQP